MMGANHPGKTAAQRRVLDTIGGGNHSPLMAKATRDAMLRDGLIYELPSKVLAGRFPVKIRQFDMPISVHIAWCDYCAEHFGEESGSQ